MEVGNREKRSNHGSQNHKVRLRFARLPVFFPRAVLEAKRTVKMNGSRFFRSDCTVRSEFQNLACNRELKNTTPKHMDSKKSFKNHNNSSI